MSRGASLIKTIVEKTFSSKVFRTIFEYSVLNPFIFPEDIKNLNYYTIVINEILDTFLTEEEDKFEKLQKEINKILKEEYVDSSYKTYLFDISEYFSSVRNTLKEKEKYLKLSANIIAARINTIKEITQSLDISQKFVSTELPSLIYNNLLISKHELEKVFSFTPDEINKILIDPLSYYSEEKVINLSAEIKQIFNTWKQLVNIKELINEYEQTILKFELGNFKSLNQIFEELEKFKYNIKTLTERIDYLNDTNEKDEFLVFNEDDEESVEILSKFVMEEYNVYETGWLFWDIQIGGFETGSVYIVAAPTNHGKSTFLLNISKNLIEANLHKFKENDAILFVTLEDNKIKLTRRILSIFGNYSFEHIRRLYDNLSILSQYVNKYEPHLKQKHKKEVSEILKTLKRGAINNITKGIVNFIIRDVTGKQNEYSVTDLIKDIEYLKNQYRLNVRAVIIDYLNLMKSTKRYDNEYSEQGQLVNDLKAVAKMYMMPVITATQLSRLGETQSSELSTAIIGDSYKKAQNSDYIIMIRKTDVFQQNQNNEDNDKKKPKKKKIKTIFDLLRDFNLDMVLTENLEISKKIDDVLLKCGAPYFNLENISKKYSIIEKLKMLNRLNNEYSSDHEFLNNYDNIDDDDFEIFESDGNSEGNIGETRNVNHIYKGLPDYSVYTDILSLMEYKFTKKKDSGQPLTPYLYLSEIFDRKKFDTKKYKNVKINFPEKYVKIRGATITAQTLADYASQYILFNKQNNRIYDIVDISYIDNEIKGTVEKFGEIYKMFTSLSAYKKLNELWNKINIS